MQPTHIWKAWQLALPPEIVLAQSEGVSGVLPGLAIDHHIIYVCPCRVHHVNQNLIHQALQCRWGVPKAKGHEHILKLSGWCTKSCLLNIGGIHRHLVESFIKIKFREILCLTQTVDNLIHPRHWVEVFSLV